MWQGEKRSFVCVCSLALLGMHIAVLLTYPSSSSAHVLLPNIPLLLFSSTPLKAGPLLLSMPLATTTRTTTHDSSLQTQRTTTRRRLSMHAARSSLLIDATSPVSARVTCRGVGWGGMGWDGVKWSGVEWSGVEWSGVEWRN